MALRCCPVCRSSVARNEIVTHPPESEKGAAWPMIECAECGLAYLQNCPSDGELYAAGYYGRRSGLSRFFFEPFNRRWARRKARRLMRLGHGRRWLDYGCGRGDLLEALHAQGCEIWGIETQKDCAAELGRRWKGRIGVSLKDLSPPPEGWDGIALYHVLEHVENPQTTLMTLRRFAGPDAALFLAVPNWESWERRVFGDRWFHLDVPRHIQHFSPGNLTRLLDQAGWTVRRIEFKATAYDFFGLFQSLLNLGPGPRNYFYRRLKRGETFEGSPAEAWSGFLWTLVAILPAAAVSLLLVPGLVWLRRSGTFEVVACAKRPLP